MLSDKIWNALQENGREKFAPFVGKTIKSTQTGKVGKCWNYTLCGQLMVKTDDGEYFTEWAEKCVVLED